MGLDIYSENILDHFNSPRNFGILENSDTSAKDLNPLCGDEIEMFLRITDGTISELKFSGKGCAISQAAASILTEAAKGKKVQEVSAMQDYNMYDLLGVQLSPMRAKCALLSLKVLKLAVYNHLSKSS